MSDAVAVCRSFVPGHRVHVEQARLSADGPAVPVELVEANNEGLLTIEVVGERLRLWTHEAALLADLVQANRGRVEMRARGQLLRVPSVFGSYLFSVVAPDSKLRGPCQADLVKPVDLLGGPAYRPVISAAECRRLPEAFDVSNDVVAHLRAASYLDPQDQVRWRELSHDGRRYPRNKCSRCQTRLQRSNDDRLDRLTSRGQWRRDTLPEGSIR